MEWESVIGLEVHVQLATKSKIFSGSSTQFGAAANAQANAIDLGLPGVLPVLNKQAVKMALQFGIAIDAKINDHSIFARKNYFYPDLPKGYQTSQFEVPIVGQGKVAITTDDGETKIIGVTRAHLEEDAGKSLHEDFQGMSGIDLNRAGTPLLEIVSEPDLRSAKEAVAYLKHIHAIVTYLGICDGNMAQGSMRCDANVSIRPKGSTTLGTRTEIKNVNSFRFVEKAINYEIERQINWVDSGQTVLQETRLYDANKDETRSMRSKEEANDYRYFPDPDLLPVALDPQWIEDIKANFPELASDKAKRYCESFNLSAYDAQILTAEKPVAEYFESLLSILGSERAKLCANWVMGELMATLNKLSLDITQSPITANTLASLLLRIDDKTISNSSAKKIFSALWSSEQDVDSLIESMGLKQMSDQGAIDALIDQTLAQNPEQVEQYLSGKDKVFGFFVGQVMKLSKGSANPGEVNKLLKAKLKR